MQSDTVADEALNTDNARSGLVESNFVIATDTFQKFVINAEESQLAACEEDEVNSWILPHDEASSLKRTTDRRDQRDEAVTGTKEDPRHHDHSPYRRDDMERLWRKRATVRATITKIVNDMTTLIETDTTPTECVQEKISKGFKGYVQKYKPASDPFITSASKKKSTECS
ncbi:hypothetical protein HPB50_022823 [Hyalomma asiaticum]|uniref:Uncharacterized protein n=1 Tax=Hyalomma asiaticum TaxID=266040 RepID=A0ACB7TM89_HYAAI|nr:hypothetical protein HPB50_022823 [Hyalomma asiaticum]